MANKGFVSLVALVWFISILAYLAGATTVLNNYLRALENLRKCEIEAAVERAAVGTAKRLWSDIEEHDFCDIIADYDVCWTFKEDIGLIEIDYLEYRKTLLLVYDFAGDCLLELSTKVDK